MGITSHLLNMLCLALLALIGAAAAGDTAYCTYKQNDVAAPGDGGLGGYYVRNPPDVCRCQHLGEYRPKYRIKQVAEGCKSGWKEYRGACYYDRRAQGHLNFRDGENFCNNNGGHHWVPNNREEFMWVRTNVMRHNEWYYMGYWCSEKDGSHDGNDWYTVTGEDMRIINKKMMVTSHHPIRHHGQPCMMTHRQDQNYWFKYHHQNCNEGRGVVCEVLLV